MRLRVKVLKVTLEARGYSQPTASSLPGNMLASPPPADSLRAAAASARIYASVLTADVLTPVPPGASPRGLLAHM